MEVASNILKAIQKSHVPLAPNSVRNSSAQNYAKLLAAVGDAEVVMIGEASHGTKEFYQQRAEITKQLIIQKGFTFVAAEADWPDAYRANRYVQNGKKSDLSAKDSLGDFRRFPLWMWRNTVVNEFMQWLRRHNDTKIDAKHKVAFYGMDLYSFYSSMDAVIEYLQQVSPEDAKLAKKRYSSFDRFQGEPSSYGMAAGFGLSPSFEKEVVATLVDLQKKEEKYLKGAGGLIDGDELFYTQQNARLVAHAEEYYRKMYHADAITWNLRDGHMVDCVTSLMEYHAHRFSGQRKEKVVLWAHNSHLGDARNTDASKRGEVNVGQLMREKFGLGKTFNIGFSTYKGSVTAAKNWDEPAQCDRVRNGIYNSYEHVFHSAAKFMKQNDYYMIFRSNDLTHNVDSELVGHLSSSRLERFIGVIYRPDTEKASHYCHTQIAKEYDAVIFMDETSAVEPLDKTAPWEKEHSLLLSSADTEDFPELEHSIHISNDLLDWRVQSAAKINEVGCTLLQKKDFEGAFSKFNKAAKYVEHDLQRFQTNRSLQEIRSQVLVNRAEVNFHLKNWNFVIRDCNTVLALKPNMMQAHLLIAKAYTEKGHSSEAKFHYEMASKATADKPISIQSIIHERR